MPCSLKEVQISNFKSLKNLKVSLKKFNVLVGPNGSGKTNFIEFFKFLKKALIEIRRPYVPYIDWWAYRNIVWEGNEELPITAKLSCNIDGFDVEYEVTFSGIGGIFQILGERVVIEKMLSLEREGPILKVRHDKRFITKEAEEINKELRSVVGLLGVIAEPETHKDREEMVKKITAESLTEQLWKVPSHLPNLLHLNTIVIPLIRRGRKDRKKRMLQPELVGDFPTPGTRREEIAVVFLPRKARKRSSLGNILRELRSAIKGFTILKHPNMKEVKSASLPMGEVVLREDSSNLNNVLYKWFSEKRGLPERIETVILELFPDTQIGFELTFEGRIYMKIFEKGVELHPPCIPDGLYKVLTILAGVELNPSLLAIDEVENSLYKEALEYVLDELRECESTVIITTHSPLVVDIVRLEDLLIVEKTVEGTVLSRVKEPKKLREKLAELKITQSESWLYGELGK